MKCPSCFADLPQGARFCAMCGAVLPEPSDADTLRRLGVAAQEQGKYSEAEQYYLRALESGDKQLGSGHHDAAQILNNLGLLYQATGRYIQADSSYHKALEVYCQTGGEGSPEYAGALNNLAGLYLAMGDNARGRTALSAGIGDQSVAFWDRSIRMLQPA